MVLRCVSAACNWRVYAIKFKNVDKYEIRKLSSYHSCSVDDRAGITITFHMLLKQYTVLMYKTKPYIY